MNRIFLASALTALILSGCNESQDPKQLLRDSRAALERVDSGYFAMDFSWKPLTDTDTVGRRVTMFFKHIEEDTIYGFYFRSESIFSDTTTVSHVYNGDSKVYYRERDSIGTRTTVDEWAELLDMNSGNPERFSPFTEKSRSPYPEYESLDTNYELTYTYLGESLVNGQSVHGVQVSRTYDYDSTEFMPPIYREFAIWIDKESLLPMKYTDRYDLKMGADTAIQYQSFELVEYDLNVTELNKKWQPTSIPNYIRISPYTGGSERPDPLDTGSVAPLWAGSLIHGDSLRLSDIQAKVILIDFFYKSCYPCLLAIPDLQYLHEEYGNKGLAVIGFDGFDELEEDRMVEFVKSQGMTYPVVLGERGVPEEYQVSGYPTMFLIDSNGVIIDNHVGWGDEALADLEERIRGHLGL